MPESRDDEEDQWLTGIVAGAVPVAHADAPISPASADVPKPTSSNRFRYALKSGRSTEKENLVSVPTMPAGIAHGHTARVCPSPISRSRQPPPSTAGLPVCLRPGQSSRM